MPEEVFAQVLRDRRIRKGMTQTEVARLITDLTGVELDGTAVTRIEKGERRVRFNEVVAVCTVLGIDIDEVIAPHPGDLADQVERASQGLNNANVARDFWAREAQIRQARLAELREAHQQFLQELQRISALRRSRLQELIDEHGFEEGIEIAVAEERGANGDPEGVENDG